MPLLPINQQGGTRHTHPSPGQNPRVCAIRVFKELICKPSCACLALGPPKYIVFCSLLSRTICALYGHMKPTGPALVRDFACCVEEWPLGVYGFMTSFTKYGQARTGASSHLNQSSSRPIAGGRESPMSGITCRLRPLLPEMACLRL